MADQTQAPELASPIVDNGGGQSSTSTQSTPSGVPQLASPIVDSQNPETGPQQQQPAPNTRATRRNAQAQPGITPETRANPNPVTGQPQDLMGIRWLGKVAEHVQDLKDMTADEKAQHPMKGKVGELVNSLEGLLIGNPQHRESAIGTGEYGMLNNPVTSMLVPGAEGESIAAHGVEEGGALAEQGVQAGKEGVQAAKAAVEEAPGKIKQTVAEAPGKIKRAVSPTAATQPGAQATMRAAGEGEGGIRTLQTKPIAAQTTVEKGLYKTLNDAAETDMKDLFDYREKLTDALDDPTNIGSQKNLKQELNITEQAIKQHSDLVRSKFGKDADKMLSDATAATQKRHAMEELDKRLFNNENVVSGNAAHGAEESIDVKSAIREAENMDKPSKFAPRGTPSRLQQALGEQRAKDFKQGLYDAQKAGHKVLTRNEIAGALTSAAGLWAWLKH